MLAKLLSAIFVQRLNSLCALCVVLPFDGPNYPIGKHLPVPDSETRLILLSFLGNGLNLATSSTILLLSVALLFWQMADNKRRDKRDVTAELAGLTTAQVEDLDWKHPAHRWRM